MHRLWPAAFAIFFVIAAADTKSQTASYVTNDDIHATLMKAPPDGVADQQIRVFDLGRFNVGIGVVHRSAKARQGAIEHDQLTEVYHILDGTATLVTGGTLVEPKRSPATSKVVTELNGPSIGGTALKDGESRKVGPGDVVVIPAGVGHWFSQIDDHIDYLVVRPDVEKVLHAK